MRRTTSYRESLTSPVQRRLDLVAPAPDHDRTPVEVETISRYRLMLVREEGTPYEVSALSERSDVPVQLLFDLVAPFDREVVGALFLNVRNRPIGHHIAYVGTLSRASAEPRGILVPALLANAASVILFHNHPSGDPTPSANDFAFTRRLAEAGKVVGIPLLDHLVLGEPPHWVSLKERGAL